MRKYLGLENYDDIPSSLFESLDVDGFILGDPFCSYRMFRYGVLDMMNHVMSVCSADKEAVYQTPVYVTNRNFGEVTRLISFLHDKLSVNKYLVQDVGLACWIRECYTDASLIWSHWGRNRNSLMNHDFIEFLIHIGINGMETDIPERINKIQKVGLPVYAVYGNTVYNTLSRECYNSYMLNRFDGMCERECLSGDMSLCSNCFSMTIDGHILGRKIHYSNEPKFLKAAKENAESIVIYGSDYQTVINILRRLKTEF